MHTDPICGMEVTPDTAAAAWEHDGTTYYFCSVGCMERFRDDPERFLETAPDERGNVVIPPEGRNAREAR